MIRPSESGSLHLCRLSKLLRITDIPVKSRRQRRMLKATVHDSPSGHGQQRPAVVGDAGGGYLGRSSSRWQTLKSCVKQKTKAATGSCFTSKHVPRSCGPTETRRGKTNTRGIYGVEALNGRVRVTAGDPEPKQGPHRWAHALTAAL